MACPPYGSPAPSTGRPRELKTMQAVFPIVAEAAVTPTRHAGENPIAVCVFGGGVATVPKLNLTPDDNGAVSCSRTQVFVVLSQRSSTNELSTILARTRARVRPADARIFARPTRPVTVWASF